MALASLILLALLAASVATAGELESERFRPTIFASDCAEPVSAALLYSQIARRTANILTQEQIKYLGQLKARVTEITLLPSSCTQPSNYTERAAAVEVRIELTRIQPLVTLFQALSTWVASFDAHIQNIPDPESTEAYEKFVARKENLQLRIIGKAREVRDALEELEKTQDSAYAHLNGVRILNERFASRQVHLEEVAEKIGLSVTELNEISLGNEPIRNCALVKDLAAALAENAIPFAEAWGLSNCEGEGDADKLDRLMRAKRLNNEDVGRLIGLSPDAVGQMRISGREKAHLRTYFDSAFRLIR